MDEVPKKIINKIFKIEFFYFVQPLNQRLIHFICALDHPGDWIVEPILEIIMRSEHIWHQKMEQCPQFHQGILQWSALIVHILKVSVTFMFLLIYFA
jgi:hypothetical protein